MTETGPSTPEPRVHCPTCGKRFRVDPKTLADKPDGAPARCSACGTAFRVRVGDQKLEVLPDTAATRFDTTPGRAADGGGKKRRPPSQAKKRRKQHTTPRALDRKASPPLPAASIGLGERVGRYEIDVLLDRGGMGAVYRAFDPAANRDVALKVLSAGAPEENRQRFRREVEVQGNIQHPHIMPILDSGTLGTSRYFTMELLKDPLSLTTLIELCRTGNASKDALLRPVSTAEGLLRGVLLPVCHAVHHANVREGVLHRDLKPDNVLIDRNGLRPFIIDFGICSLLERKNKRFAHLLPESPARLAGGGVRVTGTLTYMPPEQARGESDRRGDVWALGAILHHVVTGEAPLAPATRGTVPTKERIEGLALLAEEAHRKGNRKEENEFRRKIASLRQGAVRTIEDLQRDVLSGTYLPRSGVSPGLNAIIAKAMAPAPDQRYRHALDLHDDLLAWLEGRPVRALLERWGPIRRGLYAATSLVHRHRKAAALLLIAGGLGASAALGVLARSNGSAAQDPGECARRLEQAQDDARAGRHDDALAHALAVLELDPTTAKAHRLIEDLTAREHALRRLAGAVALEEKARAAFEAGRFEEGRALLPLLGRLLADGELRPLEEGTSHDHHQTVQRLRRAVLGRRTLRLNPPLGSGVLRAFAVDPGHGGVDWARATRLEGKGPHELPYGRWILEANGPGRVCWTQTVLPGAGSLGVECPFDPARVPKDRVWVGAGRGPAPLGEGAAPALLWDATEVTAARYARFLESLSPEERGRRVPRAAVAPGRRDRPLWPAQGNGFVPPADAAKRPVEGVSLKDAQAFALFEGGRLPTAVEWAWAATGGAGRLQPLGPIERLRTGGVRIAQPGSGAAHVGTTAADRASTGLFDMAGNLAEFTSTLATFRGTSGWLVMGGGYATPLGRALVTEAEPVPGWMPLRGVGIRLVYEVP